MNHWQPPILRAVRLTTRSYQSGLLEVHPSGSLPSDGNERPGCGRQPRRPPGLHGCCIQGSRRQLRLLRGGCLVRGARPGRFVSDLTRVMALAQLAPILGLDRRTRCRSDLSGATRLRAPKQSHVHQPHEELCVQSCQQGLWHGESRAE
eukprot:scaffold1744_cov340-Prasinococcus_capsulatus_cf.AAC.2